METIQRTQLQPINYAGFWIRLVALIMDYIFVSCAVFPFIVILAFVSPNIIEVSAPFEVFQTERTLDSQKEEQKHSNGSVTIVETNIKEKIVLNKWVYHYKETVHINGNSTDSEDEQMIDLQTGQDMNMTSTGTINIIALLLLCALMESSKLQASFGKMALGIKVTNKLGERLNFPQALARNVLKILSALTLFIGFMMAGWTRKKQTLHDMISGCYLLEGRYDAPKG